MADPATTALTSIAIILSLGLLLSIVSKKLKISSILLLILAGIMLGNIQIGDVQPISFNNVFLVAIAVLTLVMVVFDGTSRFKLRSVDKFSMSALRVTSWFALLNVVIISLFTIFLFFPNFSVEVALFALMFSIIVSGTDPGSVFIMLKSKANKVIEFLEVEAIVNTPIMVIFPFLIIDIIINLGQTDVTNAIIGQFGPFLLQIIVGVGTGVLMGLIVFRIMKKVYSQQFSPVAIITAALLSYIMAENLGGNGVLAVATLGLLFGNSYVKEKESLQEFNSSLNSSLIILVFVLIGLVVASKFTLGFLLKSLFLFLVLVLTRLTAIAWGTRKEDFDTKEKIFMAFSMPKGIAVAVVTFTLSLMPLSGEQAAMMQTILQLVIMSMIYSLIFSSVIDRFSYSFIRIKLDDQ